MLFHELGEDGVLALQLGFEAFDLLVLGVFDGLGLATAVRSQIKQRPGSPPLRVALGLAVPSIEAWLLFGKQPPAQVGEALWKAGIAVEKPPVQRVKLKTQLYWQDHPSLQQMLEVAFEEATRLASGLESLEDRFPAGFGTMAAEIRSWRK